MQYASLLFVSLLIWDTLMLKKKRNCSNMIQSRICPRSHGGHGSWRLYNCSNSVTVSKVWKVGNYKEVVQDSAAASQNLLFKLIHDYLDSFVRRCHFQIIFFWPPSPLQCISLYSSWALHLLCLVSYCHVFPKKKEFLSFWTRTWLAAMVTLFPKYRRTAGSYQILFKVNKHDGVKPQT